MSSPSVPQLDLTPAPPGTRDPKDAGSVWGQEVSIEMVVEVRLGYIRKGKEGDR